MCRNLAETLARKRPSPLASGKLESWASGIVRTIDWVNFLGNPSQPHHMKMTDIDEAFGVSEATGSAKSKAIRDLLKLSRLDPEWTLPSRMDENPLIWMLEVNGLIVDIRQCPREVQEIAFEKGLIPLSPPTSMPRSEDQGCQRSDPRVRSITMAKKKAKPRSPFEARPLAHYLDDRVGRGLPRREGPGIHRV